MTTRVLARIWKPSSGFRTPSTTTIIYLSSLNIRTAATASIFEKIPREELVTKFKSRLRDRQFLPGSTGGGFPEFLAEPRDSFPLGVRVNNKNQSSLGELTEKCMEYVKENISRCPAILFRDLPAKTAEDFSTIAQGIQEETVPYEGLLNMGFRSQIDKSAGTYTTTESPPSFTIEPHNEMAYCEGFPSKLVFFCLKEAGDGCGGETPLVKNKELLFKLDSEVVRKFEEKKVRYVRYIPDKSNGGEVNWQNVFSTENKEVVKSQVKEHGYSVTWNPNGDLHLWQIRDAFIRHPLTGEKIWFNQATTHHSSYHNTLPEFQDTQIPDDKCSHTYYGDGSVIEPEVLQHIRAKAWECAVGFQWRSGDLLVVDNLAVQHSRIGFTGERKVLVYLTA